VQRLAFLYINLFPDDVDDAESRSVDNALLSLPLLPLPGLNRTDDVCCESDDAAIISIAIS
jgi:hypothetical protein